MIKYDITYLSISYNDITPKNDLIIFCFDIVSFTMLYTHSTIPSSTVPAILVTPQEECAHDNNITYNRQGIMGMFLLPKDYYSST